MRREVAWRIFATEYNSSYFVERGDTDRSPNYVITPLGAKINRLFIVGVLIDREEVGEEKPMQRVRISDPSGVYFVSAGQYQPEAANTLKNADLPSYVAVVGKCRIYSPSEGALYLSVRAERVRVVDKTVRDRWVLKTAKTTLERLDYLEMAASMTTRSLRSLLSAGCPRIYAEGIIKAIDFYGDVDIRRYKMVATDALRYLLPEYGNYTRVFHDSEERKLIEKLILDIVRQHGDKGIGYNEILAKAKESGVEFSVADEVLDSMIRREILAEHSLGTFKLKRTSDM